VVVVKIFHSTKTNPRKHGQRNFLEYFQKDSHISKKNVLKLPNLTNWFNGSPKCNNIPRFYTSPFAL
jgi:hypothetical protein